MTDPASATAAASAAGQAGSLVKGEQNKRSQENTNRANMAADTDTANRREASYRYTHEMLMNAIGGYYAKQGWKMPDASGELPGYGTSRQLPFENPLYTGDKNGSQISGKDPQMANTQPAKPTFAPPPSETPTPATDGTDGSESKFSPQETNPNDQLSGKAQNNAPAENAQQKTASQSIISLLGYSPDDAKNALAMRKS